VWGNADAQLHRRISTGIREWWVRNKRISKSEVGTQVSQLDLKVKILARVVNPFCEINVAKHCLLKYAVKIL